MQSTPKAILAAVFLSLITLNLFSQEEPIVLVTKTGIGYDKLKGKVQTKRVNSIFSAIPLLSEDLAKIKSGEPVNFNQFSALVTSAGESSNFLEDLGKTIMY